MKDYAFDEYGLLATDEVLKAIASVVCDNYTLEAYEEDNWEFCDRLYNLGIIEYLSGFTGESIRIKPSGEELFGLGEEYSDDCIYYIPISKKISLFKAAYSDMDELVSDFRSRLQRYLPEEFDYRGHLRHIVGVYYG